MFSAPNGLCSSITELKHVKAVKKPWCHSSKFQALGQMLLTNQHIDTVMACWLECVYHMHCSPSVGSIACVISGNENNIYAGTNNSYNGNENNTITPTPVTEIHNHIGTNDDDNNDDDVVGPTVAYVNLERTVGK